MGLKVGENLLWNNECDYVSRMHIKMPRAFADREYVLHCTAMDCFGGNLEENSDETEWSLADVAAGNKVSTEGDCFYESYLRKLVGLSGSADANADVGEKKHEEQEPALQNDNEQQKEEETVLRTQTETSLQTAKSTKTDDAKDGDGDDKDDNQPVDSDDFFSPNSSLSDDFEEANGGSPQGNPVLVQFTEAVHNEAKSQSPQTSEDVKSEDVGDDVGEDEEVDLDAISLIGEGGPLSTLAFEADHNSSPPMRAKIQGDKSKNPSEKSLASLLQRPWSHEILSPSLRGGGVVIFYDSIDDFGEINRDAFFSPERRWRERIEKERLEKSNHTGVDRAEMSGKNSARNIVDKGVTSLVNRGATAPPAAIGQRRFSESDADGRRNEREVSMNAATSHAQDEWNTCTQTDDYINSSTSMDESSTSRMSSGEENAEAKKNSEAKNNLRNHDPLAPWQHKTDRRAGLRNCGVILTPNKNGRVHCRSMMRHEAQVNAIPRWAINSIFSRACAGVGREMRKMRGSIGEYEWRADDSGGSDEDSDDDGDQYRNEDDQRKKSPTKGKSKKKVGRRRRDLQAHSEVSSEDFVTGGEDGAMLVVPDLSSTDTASHSVSAKTSERSDILSDRSEKISEKISEITSEASEKLSNKKIPAPIQNTSDFGPSGANQNTRDFGPYMSEYSEYFENITNRSETILSSLSDGMSDLSDGLSDLPSTAPKQKRAHVKRDKADDKPDPDKSRNGTKTGRFVTKQSGRIPPLPAHRIRSKNTAIRSAKEDWSYEFRSRMFNLHHPLYKRIERRLRELADDAHRGPTPLHFSSSSNLVSNSHNFFNPVQQRMFASESRRFLAEANPLFFNASISGISPHDRSPLESPHIIHSGMKVWRNVPGNVPRRDIKWAGVYQSGGGVSTSQLSISQQGTMLSSPALPLPTAAFTSLAKNARRVPGEDITATSVSTSNSKKSGSPAKKDKQNSANAFLRMPLLHREVPGKNIEIGTVISVEKAESEVEAVAWLQTGRRGPGKSLIEDEGGTIGKNSTSTSPTPSSYLLVTVDWTPEGTGTFFISTNKSGKRKLSSWSDFGGFLSSRDYNTTSSDLSDSRDNTTGRRLRHVVSDSCSELQPWFADEESLDAWKEGKGSLIP